GPSASDSMSVWFGDDPAGSPGRGIISPMWIFGTPGEFSDPRRHVPDLHGPTGGRGEVSAVRTERHVPDAFVMALEGDPLGARHHTPAPRDATPPPGRQQAAVGPEGRAVHQPAVGDDRPLFLAGRHVPDLDGAVPARGGEPAAVVAVRHPVDVVRVPAEG